MPNLSGKTINKRYKVIDSLGRGGMAEVYKVWDKQRQEHLAAKVLRQDLAHDLIFLKRFEREAHTLAKLQHPNIVRFYGLEQDDMLVMMLMDYIEGESLRELIFRNRGKGFSGAEITHIIQPIATALHYAHQQGVVHCDLKPGNILIDATGKVYISDFGIARHVDAATMTLIGVGTPAYMAPELVSGREPSPRSDIYALGIILYEMATGGERPFTGDGAKMTGTTAEKVRWEQLNTTPKLPRGMNKKVITQLEAVIYACLQKDPNHRPATTLEVMEATKGGKVSSGLAQSRQKEKTQAKEKETARVKNSYPKKKEAAPLWRRWYTWAGAGLLTAAIVAAGFLIFWGDGEPGEEPAQADAAPAVQGEMANTPQPSATFVPTPTRDYRKNPDPITPENIERLALNTSIPYLDEMKVHQYWYQPEKALASDELIGSIWDSSTWEHQYYRIEIDPDAEFEILDDFDEEYFSSWNTTFSADQKVVAVNVGGSFDVRTYPGDELLMSTAILSSNITSIALSPDGHYLAVGRKDGRVLMWDVQKDEYLDLEMHHQVTESFSKWAETTYTSGHVYALAFSPDGRYLVSGGNDAVINIWEVPTGEKVHSITEHVKPIRELLFSQDGQYLISSGGDARIFIWDFQSFELVSQCGVFSIPDKDRRIFSQYFNQNHTKNILLFLGYENLADLTGDKNEKFILVEIPTCRVLYDFDAAEYEELFFSEDDRFLVNANEDGIDLYSVVED